MAEIEIINYLLFAKSETIRNYYGVFFAGFVPLPVLKEV